MARSVSKRKKPLQYVSEHMEEGGLHKSLGVPMEQNIPEHMISEAAKKGGRVGRQARLAQTFAKHRKGK